MKCPTWTSVRIALENESSSLCLTLSTKYFFHPIEGSRIKHEMLTGRPEMKEMGCEVSISIVTTQK